MGSICSSLSGWNKDPALTLIRWEAKPWLRQSVISLSLWRPRFDPKPDYVGFVVNKGKVGKVFLWAFQCYKLNGSDSGYIIPTHWVYGLLPLHVLKFSTLCSVTGFVPTFSNCFFKNKCYYIIFIYNVIKHGLESH